MVRAIFWQCFGMRTSSWYTETDTLTNPKNNAIENLIGAEELPKVKEQWPQFFKYNNIAAIKAHEAEDPGGKAIYIIRDGRAATVSYYHWLGEIGAGTPLSSIILGEMAGGGWSQHLAAWQPKTRPDTLLLRYEDMCENVTATVDQIAEFIDKEPISHDLAPFERFQKALPTFFRSGSNNTWREELTGKNLDLFWELHGEMMDEYGYAREVAYV
jgi:hypothetical protein